jgi:hypothetical protein
MLSRNNSLLLFHLAWYLSDPVVLSYCKNNLGDLYLRLVFLNFLLRAKELTLLNFKHRSNAKCYH